MTVTTHQVKPDSSRNCPVEASVAIAAHNLAEKYSSKFSMDDFDQKKQCIKQILIDMTRPIFIDVMGYRLK